MRVDFAVNLQRRYAIRRDGYFGLGTGRLDQGLRPGLEAQTVDKDHLGVCHCFGVGRVGGVNVRIGVRADNGCHLGQVAGDLAHHIAEDGEAGDDLDLVLGGRRDSGQDQARCQQCAEESLHALLAPTLSFDRWSGVGGGTG